MKNKKKKKISLFKKIFDLRYWAYDFIKFTGGLPTLLILRLKFHYLNGKRQKGLFKGPFILVSNHATYIDPVILMTVLWNRRISFIATQDLFSTKTKNFFFSTIRCIRINKENVAMSTFREVQEVLNYGHLVAIFPQGHVQTENSHDEFKSGAVMFATLCNVPIIQVYIHKNKHWWQRQQVVISDKIYMNELISSKIPTMEEIDQATKFLQHQEDEMKKLIK